MIRLNPCRLYGETQGRDDQLTCSAYNATFFYKQEIACGISQYVACLWPRALENCKGRSQTFGRDTFNAVILAAPFIFLGPLSRLWA